jgi:hypothetical protein
VAGAGQVGSAGRRWPVARILRYRLCLSTMAAARYGPLKINIEVECTPDEARRFLGLPEVAPMQERLIEEMEVQLKETIRTMDGKTMLEQWLPIGIKGVEQFQSFWTQLAAAAAGVQRTRKDRASGKADNDDKS